jgi:hypothetical protein
MPVAKISRKLQTFGTFTANYQKPIVDGNIQSQMQRSNTDQRGWGGQPYERGLNKPSEVVLPKVSPRVLNEVEKGDLAIITGFVEGLAQNPDALRMAIFKTKDSLHADAPLQIHEQRQDSPPLRSLAH